MKIKIDVDCTPDEARTFLGLPDVQPIQKAMMAEMEGRMKSAMASMDPESMMKMWMPGGFDGIEQLQKAFWKSFSGEGGKGGKG